MGLARSFLPLAGGLVLAAGCMVGGYAVRQASDYRQTVGQIGLGRLLASRSETVDVAEGDYFREVSDLLKNQFVEPVKDDKKLLAGAVRGMVVSLGDPNSMFFAPEEFKVFKAMRQGRYEGIGAWLGFEGGAMPSAPKTEDPEGGPSTDEDEGGSAVARMPRLTVVAVVPGGPAAKAGLKSGDLIEELDGRWVVNGAPIAAFQKASLQFRDKKIGVKEINALRKELQEKLDRSLMPMKARDRLFAGTSGEIKLTVVRGGKPVPLTITKGASTLPEGIQPDGTLALPFIDGAPKVLADAIAGKDAITIDLRSNVLGDDATMIRCLEKLAPKGTYGATIGAKGTSAPLKLLTGNPKPPKITLLVDRSTRGAAQIFALALTNKGLAKIGAGSTAMVPERGTTLVVQLPEGSGYTLTSGDYRATTLAAPKKPTAKKKPAR